jgi:hypothetical protein
VPFVDAKRLKKAQRIAVIMAKSGLRRDILLQATIHIPFLRHPKLANLTSECMKYMYYFGVTFCTSNVFCVINFEVLRQWRQVFY